MPTFASGTTFPIETYRDVASRLFVQSLPEGPPSSPGGSSVRGPVVIVEDAWPFTGPVSVPPGWQSVVHVGPPSEKAQSSVHVWTTQNYGEKDGPQAIMAIKRSSGYLAFQVAATTRPAALRTLGFLRSTFPPETKKKPDTLPIVFWAYDDQHGAQTFRRDILVPSWAEVEANYPSGVRGRLGHFITNFRPSTGGQLILFHGDPGGGKTWSLRALAREWASWCRLEYVVDPDRLFSGSASYLVDVMLRNTSEDEPAGSINEATGQWEESPEPEKKWRLLVLEDAGEFLGVDAKERTRGGLAKLLNLVDGLIGQGLPIMVLATTNEPLEKLHPAIARPGRCAFNLQFGPFPPLEADAWREAHGLQPSAGLPGRDMGRKTLADLYAELAGTTDATDPTRTRRRAGFSLA